MIGDFVIAAIAKLKQLPPGLLDTLTSSKSFIYSVNDSWGRKVWKIVHKLVRHYLLANSLELIIFMYISQCISDDDIADLRYLCRHWIRIKSLRLQRRTPRDIEDEIPFWRRYHSMAMVENHICAPNREVVAALRPESAFDRHELALWLNDFFCRLHQNVRRSSSQQESPY